MSGFDLIIFDCDGVLVDSEIIAAKVESALLTEAGYPISVEEMGERFAGMTWKNILLQVEKESEIPLSAQLLDKSEQLLDARLAREVKIIDGVKFALARIPTPHCICSNSSSERLDMMLEKVGLKPYFAPHIFSAKDLGADRVKPKPDIFLHGAKQMNVAPERTLVIEDSVHGIHGARAAGMRVVGFTGASHTYPSHADRLTDAGAETVISRMADLPAVIAALGEWAGAI
jgi:HAD superfamily hydrolase (TIGR01509 family)